MRLVPLVRLLSLVILVAISSTIFNEMYNLSRKDLLPEFGFFGFVLFTPTAESHAFSRG